jgi:hypothetical protein
MSLGTNLSLWSILVYTSNGSISPRPASTDGDRHFSVAAVSVNVADNYWRHITCIDSTILRNLEIYVDGVKQMQQQERHNAAGESGFPGTPMAWLAPRQQVSTGDKFDFEGEIGELSSYHRALTAAKTQSIYRAGSRGKCRPPR